MLTSQFGTAYDNAYEMEAEPAEEEQAAEDEDYPYDVASTEQQQNMQQDDVSVSSTHSWTVVLTLLASSLWATAYTNVYSK